MRLNYMEKIMMVQHLKITKNGLLSVSFPTQLSIKEKL